MVLRYTTWWRVWSANYGIKNKRFQPRFWTKTNQTIQHQLVWKKPTDHPRHGSCNSFCYFFSLFPLFLQITFQIYWIFTRYFFLIYETCLGMSWVQRAADVINATLMEARVSKVGAAKLFCENLSWDLLSAESCPVLSEITLVGLSPREVRDKSHR